jgi:hypothetical protein
MAERVVIAELDINVEAFLKNTADIKKQIDALKKEQKELSKSGDSVSKSFVQNVSDLKVLGQAYGANIKALSENTKATSDGIVRQKLLNGVLLEEVSSIKEARDQNKLLNKLRNETNVSTEQGKKELKALNGALDSNNEFIKENADAYLKQKINIGNYASALQETFTVSNLLENGLKGTAKAVLGLTKSALAFIATPLGALLAVLVGAFALVKNAMDRSEESTNKLKLAFSAVTGVFNLVLKALEPLGEFLIDGIVMGFDLASAAAEKAIGLISSGLSFLGFDDAAESVNDWSNEIKEGTKASQDLEKAQQKLEKSQRKARLTQLEFQKDAEKLRQIRDDESLSIAERAKANEDLGALLQTQLSAELKIAEQALIVANLRIEAEGKTSTALDAQAEALIEIADIQERLTGQESEQLANLNGLRRDAAAKASEASDKKIEALEREFAFTTEQLRLQKDSVEKLKQLADEEVKILDAKLAAKKISQVEYDTEILRIDNDKKEREAEESETELQRIADFEARKKELKNEIALQNETEEAERSALKLTQDLENQLLELENIEATETEKNELRKLLQEKFNNDMAVITDTATTKRLDAQLAADTQELDYARAKGEAEIAIVQQIGGVLNGLLGDSLAAQLAAIAFDAIIQIAKVRIATASAQQINLAQATATAPPPLNAPFIIAAGVQNGILAANSKVQQKNIITSSVISGLGAASKKFEKGGIAGIDGARHSEGGVPIFAGNNYIGEAEGGEGIGILNRGAYASFMDFNNRFGSGNSSAGFYEGGGIITQTIPTADSTSAELLSAIQSMPAPIVTVQDIQRENSSYVQVSSGANV